jgi:hypothetical protein
MPGECRVRHFDDAPDALEPDIIGGSYRTPSPRTSPVMRPRLSVEARDHWMVASAIEPAVSDTPTPMTRSRWRLPHKAAWVG